MARRPAGTDPFVHDRADSVVAGRRRGLGCARLQQSDLCHRAVSVHGRRSWGRGHYGDLVRLSRPRDAADRDYFARNMVCRRRDRYAGLVAAATASKCERIKIWGTTAVSRLSPFISPSSPGGRANSEPFVLICLFNYLNFQTWEPIKVWPHYRQAFAWTYRGMAISPEYHRRQAATLLQLAQNTRDSDTANALLQIVAEHIARAEEAVARTAAPADAGALR